MSTDDQGGLAPTERGHNAGDGGATPARRSPLSARKKRDTVLRLLRGEDLELVSRELEVTAVELKEEWRSGQGGRVW